MEAMDVREGKTPVKRSSLERTEPVDTRLNNRGESPVQHNHVRRSVEDRIWEEYGPKVLKIGLLVLMVYFVLGFIPIFIPSPGTFGDSFGFSNSFFSAAGVAGLLATIYVQLLAFRVQRDEFRLAQKEQRQALKVQQEISSQHAKDLLVQKQISDRQYFASIVSAISTWTDLHGRRQEPLVQDLKDTHLFALKTRKVHGVMLDVATEFMTSPPSIGEDEDLIARFQSDPRIAAVKDDMNEFVELCKAVRHALFEMPQYVFTANEMFRDGGGIYKETDANEAQGDAQVAFDRDWCIVTLRDNLLSLAKKASNNLSRLRHPDPIDNSSFIVAPRDQNRYAMNRHVQFRARILRATSRDDLNFFRNENFDTLTELQKVVGNFRHVANELLGELYSCSQHP